MLTITVIGVEFFNNETQEFIEASDDVVLELEHSLVSLSKWEEQYEKPFLVPGDKSNDEVIGYIKAMCLTPDVPDDVFDRLSQSNLDEINAYISATRSATTFSESPASKARGRAEIITSELIYYWLASYNVPFECETWHLNRLFSLLRIANVKNSSQKPKSKKQIALDQRALNEQRLAQTGGRG